MSASTPIRLRRLWAVILISWLTMACGAAPPAAPPTSTATPPGSSVPDGGSPEPSVDAEGTDRETEPPPLMPFGVPECDTFITRYVTCVELRVPADQQARLMDELHEHRRKWRELAKMEQGRLAVGLSCRGVAQRLKGDLTVDFGCEF